MSSREIYQRTRGRDAGFRLDRNGNIIDFGFYVGEVRNNTDPSRTGIVQVHIEELGSNRDDENTWIPMRYVSPFYGATQHSGSTAGTGNYVGNRHSYGMWFTPPDIGTKLICFFASGDSNQGYYIGSVVQSGLTQMLPAMGSTNNIERINDAQNELFGDIERLPATEHNNLDESIDNTPDFWKKDKPVHSYLAAILHQQGLIKDPVRGTIGSSAFRESPSRVFGISSPGRPIYDGGLYDEDVLEQIQASSVKWEDVKVIGRRSGHSFVMDDGDISGNDQLVRIRTSKGHQILLSDDGDCLHFIHANGHTWFELGKEGTIDFFSTNSVNIRTHGVINFHADKDINLYAGKNVNLVAQEKVQMESVGPTVHISQEEFSVHSKGNYNLLTDSSIAIKASGAAAFSSDGNISVTGKRIDLNSGSPANVSAPAQIPRVQFPDVIYDETLGWYVKDNEVETVTTRVITHEPFPGHNKGVETKNDVTGSPASQTSPNSRARLDEVRTAPVTAPIGVEQFLRQGKVETNIGRLSGDQITGILAQQAAAVDQVVTAVSNKGVGKFGLLPQQLENAGYLKPGTVENFLSAGEDIATVLSSENVWTGLAGIKNLGSILSSEEIQTQVQMQLVGLANEALLSTGVMTGLESASDAAALLSAAVSFGPQSVIDYIGGAVSAESEKIKSAIRQAQYAIEFAENGLPASLRMLKDKAEHVGTIARAVVDESVSEVIDNLKVSLPKFASDISTLD